MNTSAILRAIDDVRGRALIPLGVKMARLTSDRIFLMNGMPPVPGGGSLWGVPIVFDDAVPWGDAVILGGSSGTAEIAITVKRLFAEAS